MNTHRMLRYASPFAAAALSIFTALPAGAVQQYTATVIPSLPEGGFVEVYDVGNDGTVVGYNRTSVRNVPVLYKNGQTETLPLLSSSDWGAATAINDAGALVGSSGSQGVIWSQGTVVALPPLQDASYPYPYAYAATINNVGDIAGGSNGRAVLWRQGQVSALPVPDFAQTSGASGINDLGVVAGSIHDNLYRAQAVTWQNGTYTLLATPDGYVGSTAADISNRNVVVGRVEAPGNATQAAIWVDGQPQVLPSWGDTSYGWAYDINDAGLVVGTSSHGADSIATVWEDGQAYRLHDLLIGAGPSWHLHQAMGINAVGQIVATGYGSAGYGSYLLTPVPESGTGVLMGMGLLSLTIAAARRRKASAAG